MKKQVRTGRRPARRGCAGKKERRKRAAQALAAGAAIAGGTQGYAAPQRFDNPGGSEHFEWFGDPSGSPTGLDMTLPAGEQTGAFGLPGVFQQANSLTYSYVRAGSSYGELQAGGPWDAFLVGVASGEPIPSGFVWAEYAKTNYPGYGTQLPYDEPTYLGVKFDLGSGDRYGWIGVEFSSADYTLDAFAWGYETEVGVPIAAGAPEPGTLAMLAVGAAALLGRRRRASQID